MVNRNELRIGNLFPSIDKQKYDTVLEIGMFMASIGGSWIPYISLFPTELSEDLLLKLGFEREWSEDKAYPEFSNGLLTLFGTKNQNIFEINESDLPIQYLHKLQNIHFDLTGYELSFDNG